MLRGVRQQVGYVDSRLAVFLERPLGAEQLGIALYELVLRLAELRPAGVGRGVD